MFRLPWFQLLSLTACGGGSPGLDPLPAPAAPTVVELSDTDEPVAVVPTEELVLPEPVEEVTVLPEPVPTVTFELRRGETLAHFARWSGLPIEVVAETSGLSPTDDHLPVGTVVRLPLEDEERTVVDSRREAHHLKRAEGYLDSRGGAVGTEFYTVRTGESATTIARDHAGVPVWLVETYNPSVDLDRLRPGQELLLPVLGDTVAETPE